MMNKLPHLLLFSLLFFVSTGVQAQSDSTEKFIDVATFRDSVLLRDCAVFVDSANKLTAVDVLQKTWRSLSSYGIKSHIPESWITKRVYLKLQLSNSSNKADSIYFLPGLTFSSIKIYKLTASGLQQIPDQSRWSGYQPLQVQAGTNETYIAELCFTKFIFTYLTPQLIQQRYLDRYKKIQYYRNAPMQMAGYLISGLLLMMFIFSMANFILSRKAEFALNGLYVACMFLLIFFSSFFEKKGGVITGFFMSYLSFALLATGTVFYIAFTRKFLDTKKYYPFLNRLFLFEEKAVLLLLISYTLLYFFTSYFHVQQLIENIMKVTALAIGIVYIITAFRKKDRLLNYLAVGNAMLIAFAMLSFYMLLFPRKGGGILNNSLFYYELGIVCELMFFILGLAYKNRIELIEKTKEQEALKLEAEKQIFETKIAVLNARQKERNRISADMHDELGAGITAIRLYSELAKSKPEKDCMPEIEKISYSANELLNSMNTIIWAMSSSNDSLENMVAYIRSYSQEYFENTGVRCKINIMEGLPNVEVSGAIRKNVFLVVKETLNNILKHAKATEVTITLTRVNDGLSLFIQDNGTGINLDNIRRFGNGLKNMQKRMEEMNIDFSIENNNGTLVTLHYAMEL